MYLSITPPRASTIGTDGAEVGVQDATISRGVRPSEKAVKPRTSENMTVTKRLSPAR